MSSPGVPQIKYLARMSEEQRAHVFELAKVLGQRLGAWSSRYPGFMQANRIPQASLTLAATAPFLDADALLPPAMLMAWIFAVDDLFDGSHERGDLAVPASVLLPRLERCLVLLGDPRQTDTGGEQMLEVMRDVRDALERHRLFAQLRQPLAQRLRDMVYAMKQESEWSAGGTQRPALSISDYFVTGRLTTGALPIYLSTMTTMGDDSVPAHLPRLQEMSHQAACGIRCANELRGYEREVREGKLNGLRMVQLEIQAGQRRKKKGERLKDEDILERARERVKTGIRRRLARCQKVAERGERTTSGNPERFILNIARFICDFYVHHDFHPQGN